MVTQIITSDVWEAAYMLIKGASLDEIEAIQVDTRIICRIILTGKNINQLQINYLSGQAEANIFSLRRMVGQVTAWIHSAKKKFKHQLKQDLTSKGNSSSKGGDA